MRTISLSRRTFLAQGTLFLAGTAGFSKHAFSQQHVDEPILRIALMTDVHYSDREPSGAAWHYRESLEKLGVMATETAKHRIDFAVELGDFITGGGSVENAKKDLQTIDVAFAKICKQRHYVLGNHCVNVLTKEEFLAAVGQNKSYYSFDVNGWHFVVLDACFRNDGIPYGRSLKREGGDTQIPEEEIDWLRADLASAAGPTIVFIHQRLDLEDSHSYYSVNNADRIRAVLEGSGKVRLVLQGHEHSGGYKKIGGIHYCTLTALVQGPELTDSAFAFLEITKNADICLHGFCRQASRAFPKPEVWATEKSVKTLDNYCILPNLSERQQRTDEIPTLTHQGLACSLYNMIE